MYKEIQINDFRLFKNQTILLGKYLTVLSGRNSTGKSTILGMIANSGEIKKKDGLTYSKKAFRAEFSELFKGSKRFDKTGPDRFKITLCDEKGDETDCRSFRTTWQAGERFRVIPLKKLPDGGKTEAKFNYPVIYLGLSRLFPIGESKEDAISTKVMPFESTEHRKWFFDNYKNILSMHTEVLEVTNYSIGETDKKSGIGINTDAYDYLTNSSGQDNLGQILLALLSFRRLKEKQGDSWQGGILLIDEIDATLHPAAQIKLIGLLIKEAKENGIQIVVTTHSLSFLRNISEKTAYNTHSGAGNNNVELYYLTNANRRLEIKRNPPITEIENDLMIISAVQSSNKIKLYSEDAEARWFLEYLVGDYLPYVDVLDVTIGCDQLISLYNADLQYFGNVLVVFDGDVKEKSLEKIPESVQSRLGNILKLPGDRSPEEMLFDYLLSLDAGHDFWSAGARIGFTWDYFRENGPESSRYQQAKKRERCKAWFVEHKRFFESTRLMEFWMKDHPELVQQFKNDFCVAHRHIAKRMMVLPINEC